MTSPPADDAPAPEQAGAEQAAVRPPLWRRPAAVRTRTTALLVAVALLGAAVGWALAPSSTVQVGPLGVRLQASVLADHPAQIDLPPVGQVGFDSHRGPLGVRASVESVDVAAAEDLLDSSTALSDLAATAPGEVRSGVLQALGWAVGCALVGSGLAAGLVYRSRRRAAQAVGVTLVPLVACGLLAGITFDPASLDEPRFTGLLSRAPYLAGEGRSVVARLESYRSGVADMVRSVTTLYTAADELPVIDDEEVTTVLHVSDIHLGPQGYDLADQLIEQFGVDVVVDTGDVTTWGTAVESGTLSRIGRLGVPYVFVRGNHDSVLTAAAVADQGAYVLDGEAVTVEGLTFAGIADGRFSPSSGELDIEAARETAGEQADKLASVVRATNRSGDDVDVALIHDPSRLDPLLGTVPLVLSGHYHSRTVRLDESGTRVMVQGSTGGAGITQGALDSLERGEPVPLQASLLYFAKSGEDAGRLVGWDDVTVGGLGLSSVQIDRTLVTDELEEAPPEQEPTAPPEPADGSDGSEDPTGPTDPDDPGAPTTPTGAGATSAPTSWSIRHPGREHAA